MFEEYDVVSLRSKIDDVPLPAGTMGTVLLVYPDKGPTYYVEFTDELGETLGLFYVKDKDLIAQTDATGRNIGQPRHADS
jgi:hypothetical protein